MAGPARFRISSCTKAVKAVKTRRQGFLRLTFVGERSAARLLAGSLLSTGVIDLHEQIG
jgi:hypothetical protein